MTPLTAPRKSVKKPQQLGQQGQDRGSQQGTDERRDAAQYRRPPGCRRRFETVLARADEEGEMGVEAAGHAGDDRAENEGQELVAVALIPIGAPPLRPP